VLTAVLLADSFTQRFRPITIERPKVLLPLVNTPMIEYTLEWLAMNKVEETIVFCCAHADQIKKYLADSKWGSGGAHQMRVSTLVSTNCLSAGEALRLIDQKDIIKNDFILVSGDTVSNMNLAPVLEAHRARRAADKNAIMTMIMKATQHANQRLRLGDTELLVCIDPATKRLLKYHEQEPTRAPASVVKVDASFFSERDSVQVRTDLMDSHISICAPEVLMLFSDNFDYQNVKRDFVTGVLSEEELGNKLYVHEVSTEYAAHVHNLRSYDAISRDIMQRWAFPFVPDTNVLHVPGPWTGCAYQYARGHVYVQQQVQVARTATLVSDVCVGAGTSIGDNCRISQSVIGRNCRVGKNVEITGSYLQDNVTIQDGAVLRNAMVCENAVVRTGAGVEAGAILSYGVVIGPRHKVTQNMRLTLCHQNEHQASLSDDELEYANAPATVSAGGGARPPSRGRSRPAVSESGSDDSAGSSEDPLAQSMEKPTSAATVAAAALAMGRAPESGDASSIQFDEELVGYGGAGYKWRPNEGFDVQRYSIAPPSIPDPFAQDSEIEAVDGGGGAGGRREDDDEDEDEDEDEELDPEVIFKREVSETFLRCVKMRFDQTNAVIELNGLKIAEDRTFADCARYIFTTMLALCLPAPPHHSKDEYTSLFPKEAPNVATQDGKLALLKLFKKHLSEWVQLLQRFLRSEDDQVELLLTFEEFCSEEGVFEDSGEHGKLFSDIFPQVLQQLYDADVVSEEAFIAWADEKEHAEEHDRAYLKKAAKFIEWLRTADEDEDEDEDEDDDDDEDDDEEDDE